MLIIVEYRNVEALTERALDDETVRSRNILEIYTPDSRLKQLTKPYYVFSFFRSDLKVEDINVGKGLEKHALTFHYRLRSHWANVAQAKHRGPIGDDRYQIAARSVPEDVIRGFSDSQARLSHTW